MKPWVALVVIAACAGASGACSANEAVPKADTTSASPATRPSVSVEQILCEIDVTNAVHETLVNSLDPSSDPRADDLTKSLLLKYGPESVEYRSYSLIVRYDAVQTAVRRHGIKAGMLAAEPMIGRACFLPKSTPTGQFTEPVEPPQARPSATSSPSPLSPATALPDQWDALPNNLGSSCIEVMRYWAPLLTANPANAKLIVGRVYGGRASVTIAQTLIDLSKDPRIKTKPEVAVHDICEYYEW